LTPSRQELLDRAYTILESLDLLTDIRRLADHEHTMRRFVEDVIEELESA
jgi:hypothetical protein